MTREIDVLEKTVEEELHKVRAKLKNMRKERRRVQMEATREFADKAA
eukprot:SAG11_NODE_22136_length_411_cov_1.112179_1_plen_46_part_10